MSGMDGCINTSSLLNGSYRLFIEATDHIPLKDTLSYNITIQNGATTLPEVISDDSTISGVCCLTSDVSVVNGAVLTISPGTKLYIESGNKINIENGALNAIGNKDYKIIFTSVDEDSFWGGIRCPNDSTSVNMQFCELFNSMNEPVADSLDYYYTSANRGGVLNLGNPDYSLVENCEFTNCRADFGGAVYVGNDNTSIHNNKFFSNIALDGGAIYVDSCSVNLKGNYFTGNSANQGSAVYFNNAADVSFYNNTVLNNLSSANNGALYINKSYIDLLNSVLWGNGSGSQPVEVHINRPVYDPDPNVILRYCNIPNGINSIYGPSGSYTTEGCISSDPQLVPSMEFGYVLSNESPCIDAGMATTDSLSLPICDLVGNPRFDLGSHHIDIGSFERPQNHTSLVWTDDITEDTIWSADTVYVANTISVSDSVALIINSGVKVVLGNGASIIVLGTMKTMGTPDDHVVFTPVDSMGAWGKLILAETAGYMQRKASDFVKVTSKPTPTHDNPKYSRFSEFLYTDFTSNPNSTPTDSLHGIVLGLYDNYDAVFSDCAFNKTSSQKGGAVFLTHSYPQFTRCIFEECEAAEGGAVYAEYSYPTFKQCSFINNYAPLGGALSTSFSTSDIQNTVFALNEASQGGAIHSMVSNVSLINNTIADNNSDHGGALYATNGSILHAINSIVYSNEAAEGSQLYIDNNLDIGLPMYEGIGVAVDFEYCDVEGGAVAFGYSSSTAPRGGQTQNTNNSLNISKTSKGRPDPVVEPVNIIDYDDATNIDQDPYLTNDYSISYLSPALNKGCPEDFGFNGLQINSNLLGYSPIGSRYDMGVKELSIQESIDISGTIAQDITLFANTIRVTGDLTIPAGVTVTVEAITSSMLITGNYQINVSGSLFITGSTDIILPIGTTGTAYWKGLDVSGNGVLSLTNCKVYKVQNASKGAILCNNSANLQVDNCEFYNNTTSQGKGGAISVGTIQTGALSRITISNSYFHNNNAVEGGALNLGFSSYVMVENSRFIANTAGLGGAMALGDTILVRNCQIIDNQSTQGGGGIYIRGGQNIILNCNIVDNASQGFGGGIYFKSTTEPREHTAIVNSIIWNNSCPADTTNNIYGLAVEQDCSRYYAYSRVGDFAQCRYTYAIAVKDEDPLITWITHNNQYELRYYSPCIDGGAPLPHYLYGLNRSIFAEDINRPLSNNFYDIGAVEYVNPPDFEIRTTELDYGYVAIGDTLCLNLRVSNRGAWNPLQITNITLPDGFSFSGQNNRSDDNYSPPSIVRSNPIQKPQATLKSIKSGKADPVVSIESETRTKALKQKDNADNKSTDISFPIEVGSFETVDIPILFSPLLGMEYGGNVIIENTESDEPAEIRIHGWGYDDTQYIEENTVWDADTIYVATNICVNPNIELNISGNTTVKFVNNRKITIDHGILNIQPGARFITAPNIINARIYLCKIENDQYRYVFDNLTFNNIYFESLNSHGLISNSHFINSHIKHSDYDLEICDSDFVGSSVNALYYGQGSGENIIRIVESSFDYCPYTTLISISSYPNFLIANNTFTNYQTALWINESGKGPDHVIAHNNINYNQYGYGIELYHTTVDIVEGNTISNNYIGIAGLRNSTIQIVANESAPYQTIHNNTNSELVFAEDSAPVKMHYNLIFDQLYPGYNLLRITHSTGKEFEYPYNYWGPTFDPHYDLFPEEFLHIDPVWDMNELFEVEYDSVEELFNSALQNYKIGNYLLAYNQFKQVIDMGDGQGEYEAIVKASAEYLVKLTELLELPYTALQQYYLNEPNLNYSVQMEQLVAYLVNYCEIKMEDYPTAIAWFESIIMDPPSQIDSMYAVIDLAYTYLLMQANSRYRGYVGKYPQYRYERFEDYMDMRENLISDILSMPPESYTPPVYATTLYQNFPNPFNPTTTITYSLEKDDKCSLTIYNIKGQKVKPLFNESKSKGKHRIVWDGKDSNAKAVSSGVYFYVLEAGNQRIAKKMLLLK